LIAFRPADMMTQAENLSAGIACENIDFLSKTRVREINSGRWHSRIL
jgi:hypothetical protein